MRTLRYGGVTLWQLHLYMSVYCQSRTEFMFFPSFISESDEAFDAFVSYQRADNDTTIHCITLQNTIHVIILRLTSPINDIVYFANIHLTCYMIMV